eukprot:TRINITY_DN54_c3_g2_i1.p1 TRINITY_DN54_c3_g2~~TRINITY_DN54_c3_g2_i1.p1  ORF type:complete len:285 (+),score=61.06 TRINITY_DN54_c3_g2_i1:444-1298(+)
MLTPPPVERLYAIYGVNLPTEKMFLYKRQNDGTFNFSKCPGSMAYLQDYGYKIKNGVLFETADTPQPIIKELTGVEGYRSGDGTVPYESLSFCAHWRNDIPELAVQELPGVEHRMIMKNRLFCHLLIELLSEAPPGVEKTEAPCLTRFAKEGSPLANQPRCAVLPNAGVLGTAVSDLRRTVSTRKMSMAAIKLAQAEGTMRRRQGAIHFCATQLPIVLESSDANRVSPPPRGMTPPPMATCDLSTTPNSSPWVTPPTAALTQTRQHTLGCHKWGSAAGATQHQL